MALLPTTRFTTAFKPLTQITPTTFRDGYTFLDLYENLRKFLEDVLTPELDSKLAFIYEQTQAEVDRLTTEMSTSVAQWQGLFDAFMDNVTAELEALNDQAVANLVNNALSQLRISLDGVYAAKTRVADLTTEVNLIKAGMNALVKKSENVINVLDHGAVADGVTDNSTAVQAAVNEGALKGLPVLFPAGAYRWNDPVRLGDNSTIVGVGATLLKTVDDSWYTLFTVQSNGAVGYGSGARGVSISGFTVKGNFDTYTGVCLLAANHASNVRISDCHFVEAQFKGHIFDLGGCDDVVIENCTFSGQLNEPNFAYSECIQLDNSSRMGTSYSDTNGSFDGLPCKNVVLRNCVFEPLTKGSITYYAPLPIGSHYGFEGVYQENITIEGNVFYSTYEDTTSFVRGTLHFMSARNVRIENNRFIGGGRAVRAISTVAQNSGPRPVDANLQAPSIVTFAVKQTCNNFIVRGNSFENYTHTKNSEPIISVNGGFDTRAEGWVIEGNTFKNIGPGHLEINLGPNPIELVMTKGVVVRNNILVEGRRLVSGSDCVDLVIDGNITDKTGNGVCIYVNSSNRVVITSNIITNYVGGIRVENTGQVRISGNRLRHELPTSFSSISLTSGSWHGMVLENDILSEVLQSSGVLCEGVITRTIIRNNIIRGMGEPTDISVDSAVTVDGNMVT